MVFPARIWPTLDALDAHWASDQGQVIEAEKAKLARAFLTDQVPGRPRTLVIGPVSAPLLQSLTHLKPAVMFQAYPPAIGFRQGAVPALMMDMDLPPFQRACFDLVVVSYVLEYETSPLALLSLIYEILQPQGRLLTFVPHAMGADAAGPGQGAGFWGMQVWGLLRQSAFIRRKQGLVRQNQWRPTSLVHLSQPQVPPRPSGRIPILPRFEEIWRTKRVPDMAAPGQTRIRSGQTRIK